MGKIYPEISAAAINFDQDGFFPARTEKPAKPPIKILNRVEELRVLSNLAEAGVLSAAEDAGLFSKLEAQGAFSSIEKLLPLADDLKLLSTAEALLNADSSVLLIAAAALLGGEVGLIAVVPDDVPALVALQVGTGVLAGAGAVTLVAVSSLFGVLQGKD
mmetsp:Transcript_71666/g.215379  ORF Transcript_71666/g.215379 Transcript_71666/m.215379 type:complete len:160 (-) Transcript_71666:459-938(-)